MNILDIILIGLFILSFILGYKNGFIKELVSIFKTIVVFVIAFLSRGAVGALLANYIVLDVPLGSYVYEIIGFFLVWAILTLILTIVEMLLSSFFDNIPIIGTLFHFLGAVLACIKTYLIIFVLGILLSLEIFNFNIVKDSLITKFIIENTPIISEYLFKEANVIGRLQKVFNSNDIDGIQSMINNLINNKEKTKQVNNLDEINALIKEIDPNGVINNGQPFNSVEEVNSVLKTMIIEGILDKDYVIKIVTEKVSDQAMIEILLKDIK